jgi:hypothetical protein
VTSDPTKETDDVSGAARAAPAHGDASRAAPTGDGAPAAAAEEGSLDRLALEAFESSEPPDSAEGSDSLDLLEPPDSLESPDPDASAAPPAAVAELAAACVRFVATRYGVPLDFEPDTLSLLDQWLRDARTEVAAVPASGDVVQAAAGAYLGEVIRRWFGAQWIAEGDVSAWRLCLSRVYCAFNPVGLAREALLLDTAEGWHGHFELDPGERDEIEARLAALPPAEDDEFYAPSTRFDVLSIVVEALREGLRSRGLADVRFTRDDYA